MSGLFPGQSAELSGAIKIGSELLEIDGIPTHTMALEEARAKVAGKRGSLVPPLPNPAPPLNPSPVLSP